MSRAGGGEGERGRGGRRERAEGSSFERDCSRSACTFLRDMISRGRDGVPERELRLRSQAEARDAGR